jgi:serine/threonine protein kinase
VSAEAKEARLLLELVGDVRAPVELPRQGVMTIGSSRDKADYFVEGQGVADVHCAIGRIKGGGWALKDLGSAYGTMVNGERIQSRRLEAGDFVLVGSRRLRVVDAVSVPRTETAARAESPPAPQPAAKPEPALAPPKLGETGVNARVPQVKGYRVERLLGRGGMGEVYLAVQESLGRPVALKVLASKLAADADFVKRFQAEARAAAALNHPNVVTVHDVWEENGRHFLAMEYMDRGNLEQRVAREGKLPAKEALEVLHDAAKALVYAELRGIVHRDIKPANLMQNQVGTTKLADLGLAMHLEAEATESDNKKIFGTPHFISPEQARGEKVDVRSDMYSLGATMYRLLSGRTPFEGATTRDILRGHFLEEPKPLVEVAPALSPELARERASAAEEETRRALSLFGRAVARARALAQRELARDARERRTQASRRWHAARPRPRRRRDRGAGVGVGKDKNANPSDSATCGNRADQRPPPVESDENGSKSTRPARRRRSAQAARARGRERAAQAPARISSPRLGGRICSRSPSASAAPRRPTSRRGAAADPRAISRARRAATTQLDTTKQDWLARLRADARDSGQPKPLADALRTMLQEPVPSELANDQVALDQRKAILRETVHDAVKRARQKVGAAEELERQGKFDEVETLLRPLLAEARSAADAARARPEQSPSCSTSDRCAARSSSASTAWRPRARSTRSRCRAATSSRSSQSLRGADGFEGALRALDLRAMDERLANLEAQLSTDDSRRYVQDLRAGLGQGARRVRHDRGRVRALAAGAARPSRSAQQGPHARGDRRAARGTGRQDRLGSELVKCRASAAAPANCNQVFFQRLGREYTHDELAGISVLLRLTAVLQTVDETSEFLRPNSTSVLSQEETRTIFDGYDLARSWATAWAIRPALDRELEAARY